MKIQSRGIGKQNRRKPKKVRRLDELFLGSTMTEGYVWAWFGANPRVKIEVTFQSVARVIDLRLVDVRVSRCKHVEKRVGHFPRRSVKCGYLKVYVAVRQIHCQLR